MFQVGKPTPAPPPASHHPPPAALGGGGGVLRASPSLQPGDPGRAPACLWLSLHFSFPFCTMGTTMPGPQAGLRIL